MINKFLEFIIVTKPYSFQKSCENFRSIHEICGSLTSTIRLISISQEFKYTRGFVMPADTPSKSRNIRELVSKGEFFEALELLEELRENKELSETEILTLDITESRIDFYFGKYAEAIWKAEKTLIRCEKTNNTLLIVKNLLLLTEILIHQGRLDEAYQKIETCEKYLKKSTDDESKMTKTLYAFMSRLKGQYYSNIGKREEAKEFLEISIELNQELGNRMEYARALDLISSTIRDIDAKKAYEILEESLEIRKEIGNKYEIANTLNRMGIVNMSEGKLDEALSYYEESRNLAEGYGNLNFLSILNMNSGNVYKSRGNLNKALDYYLESSKQARDSGNRLLTSGVLFNLSDIYRQKGELDKALEYQERCLILFKEFNNPNYDLASLQQLGVIYLSKGNLNLAKEQLQKSLILSEEAGTKQKSVAILYNLIITLVELNEFEQAEKYLEKMEENKKHLDNKIVEQQYSIAKALILKRGTRLAKKASAENLLRNVIESEVVSHELTVSAILHLCELLIQELKITDEPDLWTEVRSLMKRLLNIAKSQDSHLLLAETYWLQSKLALIDLELKEAKTMMNQAQFMAEEKGLERLAVRISNEYDELLNNLEKLEELDKKDATFQEIMDFVKLDDILLQLIRKGEIELQRKSPEEPVMLVIQDKSGRTVLTESFDTTTQIDSELLGGFLAAINSFAGEIFSSSGHIERIKHEEYTLTLQAIDPLLVTYVYKGLSYEAINKLSLFVKTLRESKDVWEELLKLTKSQRTLSEKFKSELNSLIDITFGKSQI